MKREKDSGQMCLFFLAYAFCLSLETNNKVGKVTKGSLLIVCRIGGWWLIHVQLIAAME